MRSTASIAVRSPFLVALVLLLAPASPSLAASTCEPIPCGTSLRAWDPDNRLNQFSIIHVVAVERKTSRFPEVLCGGPMGPPETHTVVTYRDWRGGCLSAGSKLLTLYGNGCFADVNPWPTCCSTLVVQAAGSDGCLRFDFLDNCECGNPK